MSAGKVILLASCVKMPVLMQCVCMVCVCGIQAKSGVDVESTEIALAFPVNSKLHSHRIAVSSPPLCDFCLDSDLIIIEDFECIG